jgi:ABC-type transport system involved in multi-copper enzyme maturation permease subunit
LKGKYGPITIASREKSEFLLAALPRFDFATLTALLLSLMGVFFAYSTVASEREEGTLAVALSYSLPRTQLVLAEYLASVVSVFASFSLGLGTFILVLNYEAPSILSDRAPAKLVIFVGASLIFIGSFVGLGMVASVLSRQSITALVIAFLSWVGLVVVYPSLSAWAARAAVPLKSAEVSFSDLTTFELAQHMDEPALTPSKLDQEVVDQNFRQAQVASRFESVSPYASFIRLTQILAGTDVGSVRRFYEQARQANNELRAWQERKLHQYPKRENFYMGDWGPLDISGIPQPVFHDEKLRESLMRAVTPALSLCIWAILTLAVSLTAFLRYDVRN